LFGCFDIASSQADKCLDASRQVQFLPSLIASSHANEYMDASLAKIHFSVTNSQQSRRQLSQCFVSGFHLVLTKTQAVERTSVQMLCWQYSFLPSLIANSQANECLDALLAISTPTFTSSQQLSRRVSGWFVGNIHSYFH
jgi:hypothetical protein